MGSRIPMNLRYFMGGAEWTRTSFFKVIRLFIYLLWGNEFPAKRATDGSIQVFSLSWATRRWQKYPPFTPCVLLMDKILHQLRWWFPPFKITDAYIPGVEICTSTVLTRLTIMSWKFVCGFPFCTMKGADLSVAACKAPSSKEIRSHSGLHWDLRWEEEKMGLIRLISRRRGDLIFWVLDSYRLPKIEIMNGATGYAQRLNFFY